MSLISQFLSILNFRFAINFLCVSQIDFSSADGLAIVQCHPAMLQLSFAFRGMSTYES